MTLDPNGSVDTGLEAELVARGLCSLGLLQAQRVQFRDGRLELVGEPSFLSLNDYWPQSGVCGDEERLQPILDPIDAMKKQRHNSAQKGSSDFHVRETGGNEDARKTFYFSCKWRIKTASLAGKYDVENIVVSETADLGEFLLKRVYALWSPYAVYIIIYGRNQKRKVMGKHA